MSGFRYGFRTRKGSIANFMGNIPAIPGFLLDAAPNAIRAYSLRLLKGSYTGNLIKVRRASDNTEQDIGLSGVSLDTSALQTFCAGTDGFITTWYDQSGNGVNATQTTSADQPKIVSSGTVITKNSLPSIHFYPGGYRRLNMGNLSTMTEGNGFFVVAVNADPAAAEQDTGWNELGGGSNSHFPWTDGNVYDDFGTTSRKTTNPPATLTTLGLYEVLSKNNYWENLWNASSVYSTTSNSVAFPSSAKLGSSPGYASNWWLSEFVLYDEDKSSFRSTIETNIDDYYGLSY